MRPTFELTTHMQYPFNLSTLLLICSRNVLEPQKSTFFSRKPVELEGQIGRRYECLLDETGEPGDNSLSRSHRHQHQEHGRMGACSSVNPVSYKIERKRQGEQKI
jgi:hypothetical protein